MSPEGERPIRCYVVVGIVDVGHSGVMWLAVLFREILQWVPIEVQ
jgi:hypothetical protein